MILTLRLLVEKRWKCHLIVEDTQRCIATKINCELIKKKWHKHKEKTSNFYDDVDNARIEYTYSWMRSIIVAYHTQVSNVCVCAVGVQSHLWCLSQRWRWDTKLDSCGKWQGRKIWRQNSSSVGWFTHKHTHTVDHIRTPWFINTLSDVERSE